MRRTIVVAMIAAVGGYCLAGAPAFGALRFNMWSENGEKFQLGYVIGYLDGVRLSQTRDVRVQIPTGGGKYFDRWVTGVNAFYANEQNRSFALPDAMYSVGAGIQAEMMKTWGMKKKPSPSPSPAP